MIWQFWWGVTRTGFTPPIPFTYQTADLFLACTTAPVFPHALLNASNRQNIYVWKESLYLAGTTLQKRYYSIGEKYRKGELEW